MLPCYWLCVWMFKCLGWHCLATFISFVSRHQSWHFCLLAPRKTLCGSACFGAQVSSKYGTWYSERILMQFRCVGSLAGVTYLRYTALTSPKKGRKQLSLLRSCFICSCHVGVSKRFSFSISLAVYCLCSSSAYSSRESVVSHGY